MKHVADRHRKEVVFKEGDMVCLKLQPHRQSSVFKRAQQKLASKYFGPYKIIQRIGAMAYKIQLLEGARIHPMFHVSLLKKIVGELTSNNNEVPPIDDEGVLVLELESIVDTRWLKRGGKLIEQSLVRWKRLSAEDATWEGTVVLQQQFPSLTFDDKDPFHGGGIDKRRSFEHFWACC